MGQHFDKSSSLAGSEEAWTIAPPLTVLATQSANIG